MTEEPSTIENVTTVQQPYKDKEAFANKFQAELLKGQEIKRLRNQIAALEKEKMQWARATKFMHSVYHHPLIPNIDPHNTNALRGREDWQEWIVDEDLLFEFEGQELKIGRNV